jgi:hypothetical protein
MKHRCEECRVVHGTDQTCYEALWSERDRLQEKVLRLRGEVERMRRERNAALGKAPASRASPSTQEAPAAVDAEG